jgi:hypothetical protein
VYRPGVVEVESPLNLSSPATHKQLDMQKMQVCNAQRCGECLDVRAGRGVGVHGRRVYWLSAWPVFPISRRLMCGCSLHVLVPRTLCWCRTRRHL